MTGESRFVDELGLRENGVIFMPPGDIGRRSMGESGSEGMRE